MLLVLVVLARRYEVWWRVGKYSDPEAGWTKLLSTPASWCLCGAGLVLGMTYAYRVRARNRLGWSTYSPSSRRVTVFKVSRRRLKKAPTRRFAGRSLATPFAAWRFVPRAHMLLFYF